MSFENSLAALVERIPVQVGKLETEEATKHSLVLPFIQTLGYNIFNSDELIPEFIADVGRKQGEKVDYALVREGKPVIIFECKKADDVLERGAVNQLTRYFSTTEARIGVLTNGTVYKFFSDLDEPNRMDQHPFLQVDMLDLDEKAIGELRRFTKESFDPDETVRAAEVLKYTHGMKQALKEQLVDPERNFIEWLVRRVYTGKLTEKVRDRFSPLVARAFKEFINEEINLTLKKALDRGTEGAEESLAEEESEDQTEEESKIVTTAQELEGYMIVKAILHPVMDISRVSLQDRQNYCNIVLDGSRYKRICVMYFNSKQLSLGIFDESKKERKNRIESLNNIYDFSEDIKQSALRNLETD